MKRIGLITLSIAALLASFVGGYLVSRMPNSNQVYAAPKYSLNGSVSVSEFNLPPSSYMSDQAAKMLKLKAVAPSRSHKVTQDIQKRRDAVNKRMSFLVNKTKDKHPVNIKESNIAGVPVRIFTPENEKSESDQVLINIHGGAFSTCWDSCSILESAPIAHLGKLKVISVDYRMAPEAKHPAAIEDIVKIYLKLLNSHDSTNIGIYGCSSGGILTAQATARISNSGAPMPGAIGIFGAGGVPMGTGDSSTIAAYVDGMFPPPSVSIESGADVTYGYFSGMNMEDPTISPALSLEILAKFPPTLITTGTRAFDLSPAVYTNSQLNKAGVESKLIVGEGMGHCYQYLASLPEAQDAYKTTVSFFKEHLKHQAD